MPCYRVEPGAIILTVRLTPHADRDSVEGVGVLSDGQTVAQVRVRALPEDGAANQALIALLSKVFRQPKSVIHLAAGAGARIKQLRITGNPVDLAAIVESWSAET
jgi:uncharacterized protein YggU (UPF0235/DUF167 family)